MKKDKFNKWELALPLLASTSLLISSAIASSSKPLWNDELLSFYLLNDRSLLHVLTAWSDTFNQAPPLYFVIGWFWNKIFGPSDLSLRLYSSIAIGAALTLTWLTLRRTYSFWVASLATLSVFSLSTLVAYHNSEVRMYGLFAAACACGLYCYDQIQSKDIAPRFYLVLNGLAQAAIIATHLYGVFYSSAFLVAFLICDICRRRLRSRVYLSTLCGWVVLLPLGSLLVSQSNNHARWFTVKPFSEVISYYIYTPRLAYLMIAILLVSVLTRLFLPGQWQTKSQALTSAEDSSKETSLLVLSMTFMAVPLITWFITISIKPILSERYIIPTVTTSWPILWAYLMARLFPSDLRKKALPEPMISILNLRSCLLGTLVMLFLLYPISKTLKANRDANSTASLPGSHDNLYGHVSLPIAMEAGHDFLPRFHYAENPKRYFHVRDWDTAVKNTSSPFATGDFTHLLALSRQFPFIQSVDSTDFLSRFERFLVFDEPDQKWFEARVKNSPLYRIQRLGVEQGANDKLTVYLVESR